MKNILLTEKKLATTHIRVYSEDKAWLHDYMARKNLSSQAEAFRRLRA